VFKNTVYPMLLDTNCIDQEEH